MKKMKIYVDTSVIGGCCDSEFQEWSNKLLEDFRERRYLLFLSVLTDIEIENAPDEVKTIYEEFISYSTETLELSKEAEELSEIYLNRGILSLNYLDDARHIAMATVSGIDLLVSWNFKHIVHFDKIQRFNAVNIEMGYKPILIYSPREVATHGG